MDPADAGPESRERAGASHSMSGDPASDRADDSETTASCASEDYDMYPNIDDLLPDPASMRASGAEDATDFFRDVWGDTPISWRVPPNTLRSLREGFRNGDVAELVSRDCRDESNDVYDDDDVAEMLDRTKPPLRHTLSLPFCYAPGAHALRNSVLRMAYNAPTLAEDACDYDAKEVRDFVADDADEKKNAVAHRGRDKSSSAKTRLRFANDVDVGVYASPEGGVEASWHYDANHNVTVQLYGTKTWHVSPGQRGGDKNVNQSRGLRDATRNGREAGDVLYEHLGKTFTLTPGDAIYVPPGTWHRVVPKSAERPDGPDDEDEDGKNKKNVGGGVANRVCLSVDVRVANVPRARWTCESVFHFMFTRGAVFGERGRFLAAVPPHAAAEQPKPRASMDSATEIGDGAAKRGGVVTQRLANLEAVRYLSNDSSSEPFWYPPRLAPYQPEMSEGADLRAELGFLADAFEGKEKWREENRRAGMYDKDATVAWHPMVAAAALFGDCEDSEGPPCVLRLRAVSGLTNMEYARMSILVPGCVHVSCESLDCLNGAFPEEEKKKRRLADVFPQLFRDDDEEYVKHAAQDLLDVLTWCRYLRLTSPASPARGAKRQKRCAD
jgi:hypothetical protein